MSAGRLATACAGQFGEAGVDKCAGQKRWAVRKCLNSCAPLATMGLQEPLLFDPPPTRTPNSLLCATSILSNTPAVGKQDLFAPTARRCLPWACARPPPAAPPPGEVGTGRVSGLFETDPVSKHRSGLKSRRAGLQHATVQAPAPLPLGLPRGARLATKWVSSSLGALRGPFASPQHPTSTSILQIDT